MAMDFFCDDFYNIIEDMGEDIIVNKTDADGMPMLYSLKACLINATTAAYSTVDSEMLLKGDITFPMENSKRSFSGEYFTKANLIDEIFMLLSVIPKPNCPKIAYIYAVQCNQFVTLCNFSEIEDEYLNTIKVFTPYVENVPCYFTTTTRSFKELNAGSQDQTIYVAFLPAKYPVSPMQRLIRKTYVDGKLKEVNYQIDSVSVDMLKENDKTFEITGVINCQIVLDTRSDKNIKDVELGVGNG